MNEYHEWKLTREQAANAIERFALHHAIGDLPNSELTISALKMAVNELRQEVKPVLHATFEYKSGWVGYCSNCGEADDGRGRYCRNCGAMFDI